MAVDVHDEGPHDGLGRAHRTHLGNEAAQNTSIGVEADEVELHALDRDAGLVLDHEVQATAVVGAFDAVERGVVPDGCIDLEWIDGALRIAGPDRAPKIERLAAGATVVGFRFRPATAAAWLGLPASETVDRRIPLEAFWGADARRVAEKRARRAISARACGRSRAR